MSIYQILVQVVMYDINIRIYLKTVIKCLSRKIKLGVKSLGSSLPVRFWLRLDLLDHHWLTLER